MSTLAVVEPAHLWVPDHATGTYGDEVADLAVLYGRPLDPEQRITVDAIASHDRTGKWAALEACRVEPRQNGKTGGEVTAVTFADLFLFEADVITWTAHLFKTAREAFDDHKVLIQSTPELDRRVAKIVEANGEEAIILTTGAKLQYLARSKGGGRGLGGKRTVMDEALIPMPLAALLPTMAARENAQILYASSAGRLDSAQLRALRNRGRAGGDPSLVYVEHCAPEGGCQLEDCDHRLGVSGCALDDQENWQKANHALGRRITVAYVTAERRALAPEDFATERLGWWQDPSAEDSRFDLEAWNALGDESAAPQDPLVLGLDVSPRMASATIVALGGSGGETPVPVGEIPTGGWGKGTHWVADRLVELRAAHGDPPVVLDPSSPAGALVPALLEVGIEPVLLTAREVVQACGVFAAAVDDEQLLHRGDTRLTAAAMGAEQRSVGDAFKWTRVNSLVDISPLCAFTWALYHWRVTYGDADYDISESIY